MDLSHDRHATVLKVIHRRVWRPTCLAVALVTFVATAGHAALIDNGIVGDGRWEVDVLAGGESIVGNLDPNGSPGGTVGTTDVIFDYSHYVDAGADGGGVQLRNTTITSGPTVTAPNQVTSTGSFAGANGTVNWTAVSSIAPTSQTYLSTLSFQSSGPLGALRVIQYLDEDVLGISDDHLVVLGTPGASNFQLLTIDNDLPVGISHSAGYLTATNMTYIGWAADDFFDLGSDIEGTGASYSIPGVVDTTDLPPIAGGDSRFPGSPAYGPEDITSAIAFDVDPNATSAAVLFRLEGSPSGEAPGGGGNGGNGDNGGNGGGTPVPEPGSLTLLALGLSGIGALIRARRPR